MGKQITVEEFATTRVGTPITMHVEYDVVGTVEKGWQNDRHRVIQTSDGGQTYDIPYTPKETQPTVTLTVEPVTRDPWARCGHGRANHDDGIMEWIDLEAWDRLESQDREQGAIDDIAEHIRSIGRSLGDAWAMKFHG